MSVQPWEAEPPELYALPRVDAEPAHDGTNDPLPSAQMLIDTYRQAEAAGGAEWGYATEDERARIVWDAAVSEMRREARGEQLRSWGIDSGTPDVPPAGMHFPTARELFATVPAETAWVVGGLVPSAALAELDGAMKKAGKTTFLAHLVRAVLDGEPFLGRPTMRGPVVILSEQPVTSLRASFAGARLLERDELLILTWSAAAGRPWRDVAAAAIDACRECGAVLLVVDTLPQWAGLRGDLENASGAALEAIAPLQAAAGDGLAIVIVRHDRKGGGEVGDSARGSTAFGGAVDVILQLRRGGPDERPTVRYLSALSRFPETPDELVVELTPDGYVALGDGSGYAKDEAKRHILEALGDGELRRAELEERTGVGGERLTEALADLVAGGFLERAGRGVKGDPQRFRRVGSNHSGGTLPYGVPPDGMHSTARPPVDDVDMTEAAAAIFAEVAVEPWE